jgi:hypothetical protein
VEKGRTLVSEQLEPNQSIFVIFRKEAAKYFSGGRRAASKSIRLLKDDWLVTFDTAFGGPSGKIPFPKLSSWSFAHEPSIRFYSGTATYHNSFEVSRSSAVSRFALEIDSIYDIATVKINGIDCGTLWTQPYHCDITKAVRTGKNNIEIEVTNTWRNRLIGDNALAAEKRITWTNAPFRLKDKPLLPAGLMGEVKLIEQKR